MCRKQSRAEQFRQRTCSGTDSIFRCVILLCTAIDLLWVILFGNESIQSVSALRCRPSFDPPQKKAKTLHSWREKSFRDFSTSAVVASSFIRQKCYIRLNSCSLTVCSTASEVIATIKRLSIVPTAMGFVLNLLCALHLINCLGYYQN